MSQPLQSLPSYSIISEDFHPANMAAQMRGGMGGMDPNPAGQEINALEDEMQHLKRQLKEQKDLDVKPKIENEDAGNGQAPTESKKEEQPNLAYMAGKIAEILGQEAPHFSQVGERDDLGFEDA